MVWSCLVLPQPNLDAHSDRPLYRQLYEHFLGLIRGGQIAAGDRLPATRELAGSLGLNRATVAAAYELLESEGLITGHVGRGSFVTAPAPLAGIPWERLLEHDDFSSLPPGPHVISFATSRPAADLFPLDDFRASCRELLDGGDLAEVLQLGSPAGYEPLRHHLLAAARAEGVARPGDDLLITNGCQQGLDLLARVLLRPGDLVAVEDPVYPGLRNLLRHAGARLAGIPTSAGGADPETLAALLRRERPKLLILTPTFQNPTGGTMPAAARKAVSEAARQAGSVLVENDIYGELRYHGEPLPALKSIDADVALLRSFSKVTFPGLRVGWVLGPRRLITRLTQVKQLADLHTDQLAQAALLRFIESGRLAVHRARVIQNGRDRLAAVLEACARYLPPGTRFTRPQGGMNLWVELPEPLDAGDLLPAAHAREVSYLPGKYFTVQHFHPGSLRLSFAALAPDAICRGIEILGEIFASELHAAQAAAPAQAVV